jgi:protease-4
MANGRPGFLRRFFGFLFWIADFVRRLVLNVIFWGAVAVFALAWFFGAPPALQENTALVLNIKGPIVEQYTGSAREAALAEALGAERPETQLRDVLAALDEAAQDPNIARVVLVLDDFAGAGLATLREVGGALERFRAGGKQVVAWGSNYSQAQYFIAAHADEVYLHPAGFLLLRGFGGLRNYYKDALDKLGVSVNVFRVGTYKSFAEPFVLNGPSKEAQEDEAFWLNDAWATYVGDVERLRKLPAGSIARLIDELPQRFAAAGGDATKLALAEKLIDGTKTRDELRALLIERGARDPKHKSFRQISLKAYLARQEERGGDAVGVVVAAGEIVPGDQPQGLVGGRSTAELIRRAREDDSIKAIVLRIDSPGGSAFASEEIRRELELTRTAGKPVVVSMGDVAASGGYWISMAADEVYADAATITGSIGVFALLPTVDKSMDKLSLHTAGVTTTWLAAATDPRRPLDKRVGELVQASLGRIYEDFVSKAAAARNASAERINAVAQGRVWTGKQARERGLVDAIGSYRQALDAAARRAKLGDDYRVMYVEREPRGIDRWLSLLFGEVAGAIKTQLGWELVPAGLARDMVSFARDDLAWLRSAATDPFAAYAYCFCRAP